MTLFVTAHIGFTNSAKSLKMKARSMKIIMTRQKVKSDIEVINIVKSELIYASVTLGMNNTYIELLEDNYCTDIKTSYKRYLKQLLKDSISIAEFIKLNQKNCPEKICTKSQKDCIADSALECKTDIYDQIFDTVMRIRKEVNASKPWKFEGTFDDYQEPDMLHSMLNWIMTGPKRCLASQNGELQLEKAVNNITQIICQNVKSDRQINYESQCTQNVGLHGRTKTPFSVGLGLRIYKHTHSKPIINLLSDMNLTINYDKILKIETNIAEAIVEKMEDSDGVYVPLSVQKECPIYFAIDNRDFPDGKHEFHRQFKLFTRIPLIYSKANL